MAKEVFKKEIRSPFFYSFDLPESGLCAITVKASCQPGWRNRWWLRFKGFLEEILDLHLDDEDLRVEVDDRQFGKPSGRRGLFNSPAAFSGTKTLGKIKTVIFLIKLNQGPHQIKFVPQRSGHLEEISIEKIIDPEKIEFYPEARAEDENFYSWYTFVLVEQPLRSLSIIARANATPLKTDDDDLKIVIDGKTRRNESNRHKGSFFCGFSLRGNEGTYTEDLNLEAGTHYLELFADETPTLHSVKFILSSSLEIPKASLKNYQPGPKGENYNRFDGKIEKMVGFWNDKFLAEPDPPPTPLDPNLVKAMIYVESLIGYGFSSGHPVSPDVMQVGNINDPAIHTLRNDGWVDPKTGGRAQENEWVGGRVAVLEYKEAGASSPQESIKWGARWLYHKAQKIKEGGGRLWLSWRKAVAGYNGGGNPEYVEEVYKIYEGGATVKGLKLWAIIFSLFLLLGSLSLVYFNQGKFYVYQKPVLGTRDHLYFISTLDGLKVTRFAFSRFYDDGREFNFKDRKDIIFRELKPKGVGGKRLLISGDLAGYKIANIVSYSKGHFSLLKKVNQFGDIEKNFVGHHLAVGNLDTDPEEEVIEEDYINYSNASDELWEKYYDFNESSGLFEFRELTKTPLSS